MNYSLLQFLLDWATEEFVHNKFIFNFFGVLNHSIYLKHDYFKKLLMKTQRGRLFSKLSELLFVSRLLNIRE